MELIFNGKTKLPGKFSLQKKLFESIVKLTCELTSRAFRKSTRMHTHTK